MAARYVTCLVLSPWKSSFCASPYICHVFLSLLYLFLFILFCAFILLSCPFIIFLSYLLVIAAAVGLASTVYY